MLDATPDFQPAGPTAAAAAELAAQAALPAMVRELPAADEDARLIAAWRQGDRAAMETLYFRHADRVWRYARYFSGRDDAAAEILQETFLRVIRHLSGFEGRARFGTWLFTVARSAALDYARRLRAAPVGFVPMDAQPDDDVIAPVLNPAAPAADDPVFQLEAGETRAQVRAAIARLPEAEREAIVLLELEAMSVQDAAEVLGWSAAKTKVTVFRARRRLRDWLQPVLHPPETG